MFYLKKDDIKIYCKFNEEKQPIEKIICKIFGDYAENANVQKNNLYNGESDNDMLKQY